MPRLTRPRQPHPGLSALIALAMVVMPVGPQMSAAPAASTIESGSDVSQQVAVNRGFGLLTEDDLEVEHHEFVVVQHVIPQTPHGTTSWLTSFLLIERLHRPPIS